MGWVDKRSPGQKVLSIQQKHIQGMGKVDKEAVLQKLSITPEEGTFGSLFPENPDEQEPETPQNPDEQEP